MPLIAESQLAPVFERIARGEIRMVAWGAMDEAELYRWTCPLPLAYYIDLDFRRWGETRGGVAIRSPSALEGETPESLVVVINYYMVRAFQELCDYLDRIGPFRYFMPAPIDVVAGSGSPSCGHSPLESLMHAPWPPTDPGALARAYLGAAPTEGHWARAARLLCQHRDHLAAVDGGPRDGAVLFVECLHLGGAERQLCNLAAGLHGQGWNVAVAVTRPHPANAAHYLDILDRNGIEHLLVGLPDPPDADTFVHYLLRQVNSEVATLLWHMPPHLIMSILAMYLFLRQRRPRLMVCYLDRPNVIGATAALLAGVPTVLMSGRNVNPTHFPHFYARQTDAMHAMYTMVITAGARMSANSAVGAQSYADWLALPPTQVPVVANCVAIDVTMPSDILAVEGFKALAGIAPKARVILGVFRLSPEKRPLLFVDVFARLATAQADLHAVICGTGEMEEAVRARARALGIDKRLCILGGVRNIALVMRGSCILLHVAEHEGMPNALLEAQSLGLPVVCTRTTGSTEVLAPSLLAFCRADDDVEGLAQSCATLLVDPALQLHVGAQARRHVQERHSLNRLVQDTVAAAFDP